VGNITNAVFARLDGGPFPPLTAYTELIQLRRQLAGRQGDLGLECFPSGDQRVVGSLAHVGHGIGKVVGGLDVIRVS